MWDKQSANKEWVRRQLHNPCFTGRICSGYLQPRTFQLGLVCRIDPEIAVVSFGGSGISIDVGSLRPRFHAQFHGFSNKRATQRSDEQAGCVWVRLCVCGLANSYYISRVFENHVLQAPARAKKRYPVLSRVLNSKQRAFEAPVGAARAAKQSLAFAELVRLVRGQPKEFEQAICKNFGGVLESLVRSCVRGIARIEISDDANSRFCRHEI